MAANVVIEMKMPPYDKETALALLNDRHVLRIVVCPADDGRLVPSDELFQDIYIELHKTIREIIRFLECIWSKTFFDPRSPLIDFSTTSKPPGIALWDPIPLADGQYQAYVVLSAVFIEAVPNPRGRPGSSRMSSASADQPMQQRISGLHDPIEFGVARAVLIQVYRLVRFLAGYLDVGSREPANERAMELLRPFVEPLSALTHHRGLSEAGADGSLPLVSKIITDMCEQAPAHVEFLYGTRDPREKGWDWSKEGKAHGSDSTADPLTLPVVLEMLEVLQSLVSLRLEARLKANAIRDVKRTAVKQDGEAMVGPVAEGYDIPYAATETIGLLRYRDRLPDDAMMVRIAHQLEFDPSRLIPTKAYLRPIFEACMALGAFERRRETARSVLATYGLRAWSRYFYGNPQPACLTALEIASDLPAALRPSDNDLPKLIPLDEEMRNLKALT